MIKIYQMHLNPVDKPRYENSYNVTPNFLSQLLTVDIIFFQPLLKTISKEPQT